MIIDFHTHKRRSPVAGMEIISVHPGRHEPTFWYTMGYHPWWTKSLLTADQTRVLDLHLTQPGCLALGECGMDKLKGPEPDVQKQIFSQQVEIANEWGSPVVVHCVRSFHDVLDVHGQLGKTPWVIHGFVRNKTLARQVLDRGIFLSLAPAPNMTDTFLETLKYVPMDRIFLETDSETSLTIEARYQRFAQLRQCKAEVVEEQILENTAKFFNWKWQQIQIGLSARNS